MTRNEKIITILITGISFLIFLFLGFNNRLHDNAKTVYQVYLDGKVLGLIDNSEELLDMINESQTDIKNKYQVDKVYPPNGFEIVKYKTYNEKITSAKEIYDIVKEKGDFTIKGYVATITTPKTEEEEEKKIEINILDENIFKIALEKLVTAFVDEDDFKNYINNEQEEISTVGEYIKKMSFEEVTTMKEANISVNEKIYTDATELSQYLLFGKEKTENKYTIQKGDTIASVADANKLNVREFLIANPKYKSENSLLAIGEQVNVDLINPLVTLVQELHVVEDTEQIYEKKTEEDKSKPNNYSEITQAGVTGITRITQELKKVNGETTQDLKIISSVVLRETVDEITTVGKKYNISGGPFDTGKNWGWPSNRPYRIMTDYEWRWGSFHYAIDISGPGFGSPIYAARSGTVVEVYSGCPNYGYYGNQCGMSYGNHVIIDHGNNIYIMYAHLISDLKVNVGDKVSRGQTIGLMGSSGSSTGPHLHFGVSSGYPHKPGSRWMSPWILYN